jgi:cell division protein FtsL
MAAIPARRVPARRAPARRVPGWGPSPKRRPSTPKRRSGAAPVARARGAVVLDALLAGRAWIGLIFVLLAGIVFFNVDLLRMNREITRTAERAATVKRENARLRAELARLGSSERIQKVAAQAGLAFPEPGEVRYLTADTSRDARAAAKRIAAGDISGPPVPPSVPPREPDPFPSPEDLAQGQPAQAPSAATTAPQTSQQTAQPVQSAPQPQTPAAGQ